VGVAVRLERLIDRAVQVVGEAVSDGDGRVRNLGIDLAPGTYRLVFATGDYFAVLGQDTLFPRVTVEFGLADPDRHYHLPLLLSPFGYSTYRGS
jgi:5-hydroxyisourate hydrolase